MDTCQNKIVLIYRNAPTQEREKAGNTGNIVEEREENKVGPC